MSTEPEADLRGKRVELSRPEGVVIRDIQMRFGSMVIFMVKWALAAIPAFIILIIIGVTIGCLCIGVALPLARVGQALYPLSQSLMSHASTPVRNNAKTLTLLSSEISTNENGRFVTGTVANFTGKGCAHVVVEFDLLDRFGYPVGKAHDDRWNLASGETWEFNAYIGDVPAATYKLAGLRCGP